MLIDWDFDTRMTVERGTTTLTGPNMLRGFLWWLLRLRPDLEIHLLKSNLDLVPAFQSFWEGVTPVALLNLLSSDRLRFARSTAPTPPARFITRRSSSSTMRWRSVGAST